MALLFALIMYALHLLSPFSGRKKRSYILCVGRLGRSLSGSASAIMKLRCAAFVMVYEDIAFTRFAFRATPASESNPAMLNQFQTNDTSEQTFIQSAIAQPELATEETTTAIGARTSESIHQLLTKVQRKARRDKIVFWILFGIFEMLLFLPIVLSTQFPVWQNDHVNPPVFAMLLMPSVGMALMALRFGLMKPKWSAEELTRVGGLQAVGTLIDLITAPKLPKQMTPLFAALTELLLRMKASDACLLTTEQRRLLHILLRSANFPGLSPEVLLSLRLAILKALEQIGDASAIPIVMSLTVGKARTENERALKAAAEACLPLLRANSGAVEATNTLLRASAQESAAPETLLRASEPAPDMNPKELLRAAEGITPQIPPS